MHYGGEPADADWVLRGGSRPVTRADVVADLRRLSDEIHDVETDLAYTVDVRIRLERTGSEVVANSPEEYQALLGDLRDQEGAG